MIPIFWKYGLKEYGKTVSFCILSLVGTLLVLRLRSIAEFTALAGDISTVLLFTLYQLPYILPHSLPLSALIGAILTMQRFCKQGELTRLRASGCSLFSLITPFIAGALLLSLLNLWIVGSLFPTTKFLTKKMYTKVCENNPFFVLKTLGKGYCPSAYIQIGEMKEGKEIDILLLALKNGPANSMALTGMKNLKVKEGNIYASQVTTISTKEASSPLLFPHLMIENQPLLTTKSAYLSYFFKGKNWEGGIDDLPLSFLVHEFLHSSSSVYLAEILKRLTLGSAPLLLTLLGLCSGLTAAQRGSKPLRLLWGITGTILYLSSIFLLKSFKKQPFLSLTLTVAPYLIIVGISFFLLRRFNQGKIE